MDDSHTSSNHSQTNSHHNIKPEENKTSLILLPQDQQLIEASGITPQVAKVRGYYSATHKRQLARLGFADYQQLTPALVIPIYNANGKITTYQARPHQPRHDKNGKAIKYETPSGSSVVIDVPPSSRPQIGDRNIPLHITEGIRKADCATSRGLCCIALMGVASWRGIEKWQGITLERRRVYLDFDSDVMSKEPVQRELRQLHQWLTDCKAEVQIIYFPSGPHGKKVGLDDYLVVGHTIQDLLQLADKKPPLSHRFKLLSALELKNRPPIEWRIERILPEIGLAVLMGPEAVFKSFIGIDWCLSIAAGIDWHGHQVKQASTLYISGEGSSGLPPRLKAWEIARGVTIPDNCYFLPEAVQLMKSGHDGDVEVLIQEIQTLPKLPGFIVIDTVARCMVGGDENSARDMGMFIAGADKIRQATGAFVLLIHHANKDGGMRGSTALPGAVETRIEMKREGDTTTLKCTKQKDAEEFQPIRLIKRVVEIGEGETSLVFDPAPEGITTPE
jgi:hypothetical protein